MDKTTGALSEEALSVDTAETPPRSAASRRLDWRLIGPIVILAALFLLPFVGLSRFRLNIMMLAFLNGTLAAGLVVSLGYAGLLNISQATFYGIGAYTAAVLVTDFGLPFEIALLAACLTGVAAGLFLGSASIRVRGDYFALVSLAFTVAAVQVMSGWSSVTRGRSGFLGIPELSLFGFPIQDARSGYWIALLLLGSTYILLHRFLNTFAARAMLATRYDEVASQTMGIDVPYTRLLSMAISSGVAGLAGGVMVATMRLVTPQDFNLVTSFTISVWVVIGGMASLPGAVVVAMGLTLLAEEFRQYAHIRSGLIGLIVIVAVLARGSVFSDWYRSLRERR